MCEVMDFANELEKMIDKIPKEIERLNKQVLEADEKINDLEHLLENKYGKLKSYELAMIGKEIGKIRVYRRKDKFKVDKWVHLLTNFSKRHEQASGHISSAKKFIKKENVKQKRLLEDKCKSYNPRHYDNLFVDDFVRSLRK